MSAAVPPPANTTTDPADEAGGEVIYSSDGLAPIPLSKAPEIASKATSSSSDDNNNNDEIVLDSSEISPQDAFEMFMGKVYSVQTKPKTMPPSSAATGTTSSSTKVEESPLERLARLQSEVAELEVQFQTLSTEGRDFDESLVTLASNLKTRLSAASETRGLEQEDLTKMIHDQVTAMNAMRDPTSSSGESNFGQTTGVTYELYGQPLSSLKTQQQQQMSSPPTSTLEERILKLETALGSGTNIGTGTTKSASSSSSSSAGGATTFAGRLDELERLLAAVDSNQLEQAATKAKVIRADLEAASKARNKLTSTYKKEDSKMIQDLHQQMVDLEGLSGYLPNLVERMQQLSGLHVASSTFNTRLGELEKSASQVEGSVSKLESTMTELKQTMKDNLLTMQSNLSKLDDSMKKL